MVCCREHYNPRSRRVEICCLHSCSNTYDFDIHKANFCPGSVIQMIPLFTNNVIMRTPTPFCGSRRLKDAEQFQC